MKIHQAERIVRDELGPRVHVPRFATSIDPSGGGASTPVVEKRRFPILPYFSVLLFGADGGWAARRHPDANSMRGHPSIGYVRVIYAAIALNWIIDALGLGYLTYTYFASWEAVGMRIGVPVSVGVILSTGFATFAISLVRKPLRSPRLPAMPSWILGLVAGVMLLSVGVVLASWTFEEAESEWFHLAVLTAWAWIVIGGTATFMATFGVMDAVYVLSRGGVMICVGYLVASPLHEAMFQKEIENVFYERKREPLEKREKDLLAVKRSKEEERAGRKEGSGQGGSPRTNRISACMDHARPVESEDCRQRDLAVEVQKLKRRALDCAVNDENSGKVNQPKRNEIRQEAESMRDRIGQDDGKLRGDLQEVFDVLDNVPVGKGKGRMWGRYDGEYDEVTERLRTLEQDARDCVKEVRASQCAKEVDDGLATEQIEYNEKLDGELAEIEVELDEVRGELKKVDDRVEKLGAIDRAVALEQLIVNAATKVDGEAASSDHEQDARAVVRQKLFAAWVLAMVMPLIVVTMKLTGGMRLEPYLRRRWKVS